MVEAKSHVSPYEEPQAGQGTRRAPYWVPAPHLALGKAALQSLMTAGSPLARRTGVVFTSPVFSPQNSPNDLQMLSDAPAHHLFCLLPPVPPTQNVLPEVLAVIQVQKQRHPCGTDLGSRLGIKG